MDAARPPRLPGVRHEVVAAGDVSMHVAELGPRDGSVVLLVHGWPQHWWCWREVAGRLDDRRCVMPDLRGHGWSDAPAAGYEKSQLAADVLRLLDELEIDRVCFVGHDWGAIVGFLVALEAPERVSALLALSVPHPWPSLRDRVNPLRLAAGLYQLPLGTPLLGRTLMRAGLAKFVLTHAGPDGVFDEAEAEVYDQRLSSPSGSRVTESLYRTFLLRELPRAAVAGERRRLEVPTRLLVGEKDPILRGADLRGFEDHAPEMKVERVPGAGHFLPEERPELVASRVRELSANA